MPRFDTVVDWRRNNPFPLRRPIPCANFVVRNGVHVFETTWTWRRRKLGRRKESEVSQLVLLRGREEKSAWASWLDERGRSSLDGAAAAAADFIRPLSSTTRRNICLRLRLFAVPATLLPDLLPATRPAGLCYAVEHDTLCNALFSRKRGTRVIHPRPRERAFDVTFTVFLTSGEEGKSL